MIIVTTSISQLSKQWERAHLTPSSVRHSLWKILLNVKFYHNRLITFRDMGSKFAVCHCFGDWAAYIIQVIINIDECYSTSVQFYPLCLVI